MAGLWTMIRLILRRDRLKLPIWIGGIVATLVAMVPMLRDMYGTEEELQMMYATLGTNPSMLFMTGPMDEPSFGAFFTLETILWWGIAVALFNTMLMVRHTRHNEEIGAQELLLSGQMRRSTGLAAALLVAVGVNALIALGVAGGFMLVEPGWPAEQSWLYAVALGAFGVVWAGIAAIVVQLVESGRTANGMLAALVGAGFLLRGIGDFLGTTNSSGYHEAAFASMLSPFGWMQAASPLVDPRWSALWLPFVAAGIFAAIGFALLAQRDVGAGLLPSRAGRQRAARFLATPLGLTWNRQKGIFFGWLAGIMVLVATIGGLVPQMTDVFEGSDMIEVIQAIGGVGELIPAFMSAMMAIICLLVFGYAIHALGKLRSEETSGHLESILATKVSRSKWLGLHVGVVLFGGLFMLAVVGSLLAILTSALSEFSIDVWEYTLSSLSYAPLLLAFMALYVVLFGILPRLASGVTWLYFGFVFFALWLGPIVGLEEWVMNLSILEHLASPPAEDIDWPPLGIISAVSVALIAAGFAAFNHRNIGNNG